MMSLLETARRNVADRQCARGDEGPAADTLTGERDGSWAMRHELAKLNDEARAAPPDTNNETDR